MTAGPHRLAGDGRCPKTRRRGCAVDQDQGVDQAQGHDGGDGEGAPANSVVMKVGPDFLLFQLLDGASDAYCEACDAVSAVPGRPRAQSATVTTVVWGELLGEWHGGW